MTSPPKQSIHTAIAPARPCTAGQGAALPGGLWGVRGRCPLPSGTQGRQDPEPETTLKPAAVGSVFAGSFKPPFAAQRPGRTGAVLPTRGERAESCQGAWVCLNGNGRPSHPPSPLLHIPPSDTECFRARTEPWAPRKCRFRRQCQQLTGPQQCPAMEGALQLRGMQPDGLFPRWWCSSACPPHGSARSGSNTYW